MNSKKIREEKKLYIVVTGQTNEKIKEHYFNLKKYEEFLREEGFIPTKFIPKKKKEELEEL